ncbi:sulfatase [Aeoliella sp. ICT_H6.2]|uniref:Sulfatase n=1 Tax=Aeoliella straminimaris TaxID=2954799 RepID=A0A9X2F8S6_9BACT|nr:sulfatase [Aeoliella straminimaris]MCO6044400.1 sulfatase [Aeoliella straminimaris]
MRYPLLFCLGLVLISSGAAAAPNVLLICVDDLKPTLGCYDDELAQTPNMDRLAAGGVLFKRAYCNQAVCAPSRNSLLTGLRPQTLGIYDLGTFFRKSAPDAVTFPQFFKQHGYRTAGMGKIYHLGHGNKNDKRSWSEPFANTPGMIYKVSSATSPDGRRGPAFESADVPDSDYTAGQLGDLAVDRLQKLSTERDQPFFLAVGFRRPHLPFNSPQKYWDLYDREQFSLPARRTPPDGAPPYARTTWGELRKYGNIPKQGPMSDELQLELIHGYYAAVSYVDAQVGRILDTLQETDLADDTIIILWGDHGWHLGDHGMWCKHTNYEQATRIPLIVAGPGVANGVAADSLVETVDIYPTICELAGLPAPEGLDGKSFKSVLEDPSTVVRESAVQVYPRGKRIGQTVRTARYRLVEWKLPNGSAEYELYDYQEDPDETVNLAAERPAVVAELKALLDALPAPKRFRG